jgi:hypothetical protein
MLFMMQGCAEKQTDLEKASDSATEFLRITYKLTDHATLDVSGPDGLFAMYDEYEKRIKPYATQHAIDQIFGNRLIGAIVQAATKHGFDIDVFSVALDQFKQDGDKIFMDYEINLVLLYEDGTREEVMKNGKLQLIKIEDVWKVNHEKSNSFPIIMMSYDLQE